MPVMAMSLSLCRRATTAEPRTEPVPTPSPHANFFRMNTYENRGEGGGMSSLADSQALLPVSLHPSPALQYLP